MKSLVQFGPFLGLCMLLFVYSYSYMTGQYHTVSFWDPGSTAENGNGNAEDVIGTPNTLTIELLFWDSSAVVFQLVD